MQKLYKKKSYKILVFIMMLVFLLQLVPHTCLEDEDFNFLYQDNKICLTTGASKISTTLFRLQTRKSFNKSSTSLIYQNPYVIQFYYLTISTQSQFNKRENFDFRKKIETTQCNQLHGSKYKASNFFI